MKKDLIIKMQKMVPLIFMLGFLNVSHAADCFNRNTGQCINNIAHAARATR